MASSDTIVALATPNGTGAIAVIRLSGDDAIAIAARMFRGKDLNEVPSHTVHFGTIRDGSQILDEVLATVFVAPHSYTRENVVEFSVHNSPYIVSRLLQLAIDQGARSADPGEFTRRAFLNGGMDLSQAEAVADVIAAENKASHEIAMSQLRGGISSAMRDMREQLINFTALLELELDFSEEDVEFADRSEFLQLLANLKQHITRLIRSFEYGNAIKNGVPVAIVGKPNAGKSTLLNTLLEEERAIVSDIAGTTRDTIEETMTIDGITFRFIDTAGLRETSDQIEAIGVARAREKVRAAKILLFLYDAQDNTFEEIVQQVRDLHRDELIVVLVRNKSDLPDKGLGSTLDDALRRELLGSCASDLVVISAKDPATVQPLKSVLVNHIRGLAVADQQIITNLRHLEALKRAGEAIDNVTSGFEQGFSGDLLAPRLREAARHIGSITGEIDLDRDILGTIFGRFCIGK